MIDPTDETPIAEFISEGRCRTLSETISIPIYWLGRSWAVTSYGVEKFNGTYYLTWESLHRDWVAHLLDKGGEDILDFQAALIFARKKLQDATAAKAPIKRKDFQRKTKAA